MKKFYFGQSWQVYGTNSVEVPDDFTIEQAIEFVKKNWDDVGLANNPVYVQDSDEADFDCCDFEDGKAVLWNKYIQYLHDWAESHSEHTFAGMTPACYDEWYDNEYQEEN